MNMYLIYPLSSMYRAESRNWGMVSPAGSHQIWVNGDPAAMLPKPSRKVHSHAVFCRSCKHPFTWMHVWLVVWLICLTLIIIDICVAPPRCSLFPPRRCHRPRLFKPTAADNPGADPPRCSIPRTESRTFMGGGALHQHGRPRTRRLPQNPTLMESPELRDRRKATRITKFHPAPLVCAQASSSIGNPLRHTHWDDLAGDPSDWPRVRRRDLFHQRLGASI